MIGPRSYLRPAESLWWAYPPYLAYTLREVTGVAVAGYALVLLAGLICLASGESAYAAWLGFLKSPWSLALHLLFLIGMIAHVWSWFQIMPKTMPRLVIGGRVLPQKWITTAGLVVAMVAFIIALLVAVWIQV
ncbi:MAG: fumarate reductase subunit C [Pseudolabrys sp.]